MKWTNKQPKVSGYYWMNNPQFAGICIVKVTIRNLDTDWPERFLTFTGNEIQYDLSEIETKNPNGKWAGPIPPPK